MLSTNWTKWCKQIHIQILFISNSHSYDTWQKLPVISCACILIKHAYQLTVINTFPPILANSQNNAMDWVAILTQILGGSVQTSKLLPSLRSINLCWMCFFSPEIFLYFFTCQVGPWKPVCVCFVFYCVWKSWHTFQIWLETSPQAHRYTEYVTYFLKFSVGGSDRIMLKLKWCST